MIQPTVGRVLWFYPAECKPTDQPWIAFICKVWGDTEINIAGFDPNGATFSRKHVLLVQDDAKKPEGGSMDYCCIWMPYKRGQAQKTEALEKQIAETKPAEQA